MIILFINTFIMLIINIITYIEVLPEKKYIPIYSELKNLFKFELQFNSNNFEEFYKNNFLDTDKLESLRIHYVTRYFLNFSLTFLFFIFNPIISIIFFFSSLTTDTLLLSYTFKPTRFILKKTYKIYWLTNIIKYLSILFMLFTNLPLFISFIISIPALLVALTPFKLISLFALGI